MPVIGRRYRQIPVPDDGRRTLVNRNRLDCFHVKTKRRERVSGLKENSKLIGGNLDIFNSVPRARILYLGVHMKTLARIFRPSWRVPNGGVCSKKLLPFQFSSDLSQQLESSAIYPALPNGPLHAHLIFFLVQFTRI